MPIWKLEKRRSRIRVSFLRPTQFGQSPHEKKERASVCYNGVNRKNVQRMMREPQTRLPLAARWWVVVTEAPLSLTPLTLLTPPPLPLLLVTASSPLPLVASSIWLLSTSGQYLMDGSTGRSLTSMGASSSSTASRHRRP